MKTNFFNNILTSGFIFNEYQLEEKSRYQIINISVFLSSIVLPFSAVENFLQGSTKIIGLEILVFCINFILFLILRKSKNFFKPVSIVFTLEFTVLYIFLIYFTNPNDLKHVWLFAYPVILLYLQKMDYGIYWISIVVFMLLIAPLQPFVDVKYSIHQLIDISLALIVVSIIVYFYQVKIHEARVLVLQQLDELKQKDQLLTSQSKQAVMGEMISMIAHQWRQPLSNITLQISNCQVKRLLAKKEENEIDKMLNTISDTIIYLSDTIDDFQTYFRPNKEVSEIDVNELVQRAVNLTLPRLKEEKINIDIEKIQEVIIKTYVNEIIQVILNILNNAIDALSQIKDRRLNIKIHIKNISEYIVVEITDNANGIPEESLEHLFEPYFSTKGKNGTGLGLYMSQMIMQKQFETKISVKTSTNGSTFTINIPKNVF